jgi:hypothetical protein
VQPGGRLVGDTGEHIGEPGARIHAVQLGGGGQGVDHRVPPAATVTAREQPGFPAEGHTTACAFGRVVRQTNSAIVEEWVNAAQCLRA